jgi:PASTA domain/PEP-CTERM motif
LAYFMAVVIDRPGAQTAATPCRRCRRIGATMASRSSRRRSALLPALAIPILIAGLLLPTAGAAAPIIGDPSAAGAAAARPPGLSGGGPPRVGIVVSCGVRTDGLTTCAVSRGQAAVCPERAPGTAIQRSYRRYDYRPVEGGCALDAEYWRTHGRDGEAPFDDTWDRLGESGRAAFFNASETYEAILADGAGAGPYYRLARAYIAAELNGINGAPRPDEVASAFGEATALFLAADPERLDADAAARFEALAEVLEDYNAGAKGPGVCPPLAAEPFSAADVATTLQGAESRDAGKVIAVDQRYGRGAGVVTVQPLSGADEFLLSDEAFTVEGVRKAKFTTELTDCVNVATGQETTIAVGGRPSAPRLTSASFLGEERLVRMMVAVSEAAAEAAELAPAAGPAAAPAPIAPASIGASTGSGSSGSFPSQVLPAATAGGGGGEEFVTVPNLIGETVAEARNAIAAAGLSIGQITVSERRAMLDGIVGVAWADDADSATVVDQSPPPGAEAGPGDPVDLTAEFSVAIPEPASLLLFATGLALIVIAMARRRSG